MVIGFLVALERFFYLHKGKIRSRDFVSGIVNLLKNGRTVEALSLCEETPGPVAAIVKAALLNLRRMPQELMLSLQMTAAGEIPLLEKRVNTLLFLSRLVQLVGLMGALWELRAPFEAVAQNGTLLSTQGFANATLKSLMWLVSAVGLGAVFYSLYHLLNGRVRALISDMERAAIELQSQIISAQTSLQTSIQDAQNASKTSTTK